MKQHFWFSVGRRPDIQPACLICGAAQGSERAAEPCIEPEPVKVTYSRQSTPYLDRGRVVIRTD